MLSYNYIIVPLVFLFLGIPFCLACSNHDWRRVKKNKNYLEHPNKAVSKKKLWGSSAATMVRFRLLCVLEFGFHQRRARRYGPPSGYAHVHAKALWGIFQWRGLFVRRDFSGRRMEKVKNYKLWGLSDPPQRSLAKWSPVMKGPVSRVFSKFQKLLASHLYTYNIIQLYLYEFTNKLMFRESKLLQLSLYFWY